MWLYNARYSKLHNCIHVLFFSAVGELEDAIKMNDTAFEAKYGFAKPSTEQTLVTHCQMGRRAIKAGDALAEKGYQAR